MLVEILMLKQVSFKNKLQKEISIQKLYKVEMLVPLHHHPNHLLFKIKKIILNRNK
jgi:hypothetical protein